MVVSDATVLRQLVVVTIGRDPAIEVVGSAPDGKPTLERIRGYNPMSLPSTWERRQRIVSKRFAASAQIFRKSA